MVQLMKNLATYQLKYQIIESKIEMKKRDVNLVDPVFWLWVTQLWLESMMFFSWYILTLAIQISHIVCLMSSLLSITQDRSCELFHRCTFENFVYLSPTTCIDMRELDDFVATLVVRMFILTTEIVIWVISWSSLSPILGLLIFRC